MYEKRPWVASYPAGIPANIDPDAYHSVVNLLDETFAKFPDHLAFSNMGVSLSFRELDQKSAQFAAYLSSTGLKPGDRIALMMPNMLQYPIALFGALRAGLMVVNTNPMYTPREMKHQFEDSGAVAIIIAENFASNLEEIIEDTFIKKVILCSVGEMLGFKGVIINFVIRKIKKLVPKYKLKGAIWFTQALKEGKDMTIPSIKHNPDDVILLQYTGGTTGVAKGAMLTNRNLVANLQQMRAVMAIRLNEGQEIALNPLPLYHIFAFTVNCLNLFSFGIHNVLVTNARDLPSIHKEFKKYKISVITGVNTLFNGLLHSKGFAELDFSALKISVAGGMALQNAVAKKWQQVTGCPLVEGYGLTETSPVASVNPIDGTGKRGTIGLPVPNTDMRIVDDKGQNVPQGEVGEIQIKGPQVMKGYYQKPEETDLILKEGWISTGDIGKMDTEGYFSIVDRKKDMILVSGFNVYPNEIEEVVSSMEGIKECCAIGIPSEQSGESVKLFVVLKEDSITKEQIIAFCRENLTAYKIPRQVEFRKELPKSNVGKILRRLLRDEVAQAKGN
ncbi:MAG: AMP-binding protein [Saprospiraceae bacterium]